MHIAIIHHADDEASAADNNYVLWAMADRWRADGQQVDLVFGPKNPGADVAIIHVDRTVVGREYFRAAARSPVVLNSAARDISKRSRSTGLVRRGDGWNGPVIVKTSRNAGGIPEIRHRPRVRAFQKWRAERGGLGSASWMYSANYAVFPSSSEMPKRVFGNRKLIVERFLPERDGDLYCVRYFKFFGDRYVSALLKGDGPIVKRSVVLSSEDVPPPREVLAMKKDIGFEYGKLDFVMHDAKPFVFDVNRTPGMSTEAEEERQRQADILAPGLYEILESRMAHH